MSPEICPLQNRSVGLMVKLEEQYHQNKRSCYAYISFGIKDLLITQKQMNRVMQPPPPPL